jgi:RPA family protein
MKLRPRLTAYKLHIADLYAGSYVRKQTGAFLETSIGPVTRVRLLGTIMQRYDNPEKKYTSLTLDDATETIRLKAWREDIEKLTDYQVGDIIDIVGKVRQQEDGELFVVPEDVFKVEDVNVELLRELEILELRKLMGGKTITKTEFEKGPEKKELEKEPEKKELEKEPEKKEPIEEIEKQLPQESDVDIRNEVMNLIKTLDTGKGASYKEIVEKSSEKDEDVVETIILDLLNEGVVYEPEPGRYKEL